jgi:hypothetical protein
VGQNVLKLTYEHIRFQKKSRGRNPRAPALGGRGEGRGGKGEEWLGAGKGEGRGEWKGRGWEGTGREGMRGRGKVRGGEGGCIHCLGGIDAPEGRGGREEGRE